MKLRKGIGIHNLLEDGYDSIFINSGTLPYTEQLLEKVRYQDFNFTPLFEKDAFLPKKDWRRLNTEEVKKIRSDINRKDYNTIAIGDISETLRQIFQNLELGDSINREEVMMKLRDKPEIVKVLNEEMQQFLLTISDGKPFHFHCVTANLPNLEMVACDISKLPPNFTVPDKKYIGMHNDGTQFMTLHTTHKFGNRIMISLGKESRIFYFVNLTMIQVVNMLKQKIDVHTHNLNIRNVSRLFFEYYPNYPVIKIIQKPYQYYIAPTDNCFHDGSTLGNTSLDISMVYFGAFKC